MSKYTAKDILEAIGIVLAMIVVVGGILTVFGVGIWYINEQEKEENKKTQETCKFIASQSNSKDWKVDSSDNCYFVKDGKLVKVEDW